MRLRLALIGVAAGGLSGLMGVGGGLVIVPGLVTFCGHDQRHAVATSLLAIPPLSVAGVVGYALGGQVDLYLAVPFAAGTMIGAWIGAALLHRVSLRLLRWVFAVMALSAAIRLVIDPSAGAGEVRHDLWRLVILMPIGVLVGILAGLTGIGGGVVMVPVMQIGFGASAAMAKGTSLLIILPTALVAGWRNLRARVGSLRDATWIGISGMLAALGGAAISVRLPSVLANLLFGGFLIVVTVRMVWPDLRAWRTQRTAEIR
jgi:uncharacterized membrane protein YfcA